MKKHNETATLRERADDCQFLALTGLEMFVMPVLNCFVQQHHTANGGRIYVTV
jgi:hypothetical protein